MVGVEDAVVVVVVVVVRVKRNDRIFCSPAVSDGTGSQPAASV